jgi:hypothetical protein
MSERGLDPESYLTEIDRRLQAIQAELRPGQAMPAPAAVRSIERHAAQARRGRAGPLSAVLSRAREAEGGAGAGDAQLVEQVRALTEVQTKLLIASERLLDRFARLAEAAPPAGLLSPTTPRDSSEAITLTAGPFAGTEALRGFERALAQLDRVRRVEVRAYEGDDRAVLDVELESGAAPGDTTP